MKRTGATALIAAGALLAMSATGCGKEQRAAIQETQPVLEDYWRGAHGAQGSGDFEFDLVAKAQPDECFDSIDGPYQCEPGEPPNKVNQSYAWGLVANGTDVWVGTAPNMICFSMGGPSNPLGPHQTDSWVCEYDRSNFIEDFNARQTDPAAQVPLGMGDWRPPEIYRVDKCGGITNMSERINCQVDLQRLARTFGLRSAGSIGDIVLLAGPTNLLGPMADTFAGGINVFAFKADGTFLGSQTFPQYNDIRRWLVVGDKLYAGVGNTEGGGSVLLYKGYEETTATTEFRILFEEVVSTLDGGAADLALHENRIFLSTWPNMAPNTLPVPFGLWMSPPLDAGGCVGAGDWQKVWQADDYEPDPVTAATYAGGAMVSFDGYLYFSTMHMPFIAALAHFSFYGMPASGDEADFLVTVLGTHRPTVLFRGRDFGEPCQKIDLLYGEEMLPVRNPFSGEWGLQKNNMSNSTPLFGHSGYGNFFNTYTWSMAVHCGHLYVGTFDWSYPAQEQLKLLASRILGKPLSRMPELPECLGFGADLFVIPSAAEPARVVSLTGAGNYTNYGIRNMIVNNGYLYLGTANPMNLLTDPHAAKPEGGWELLRAK